MTPRTSIARLADDAPVPHADSWPARKPPFIQPMNAECPDCGLPASATRVLGFACEHSSCPMFRPPSLQHDAHCAERAREWLAAGMEAEQRTRAAAYAALEAQAARTARAMIKERARAYARRPRELDAIEYTLSHCSPQRLVEALAKIMREGQTADVREYQRRWFGFGGEVSAINLRGAMLYARYSRAIASRNARRTG